MLTAFTAVPAALLRPARRAGDVRELLLVGVGRAGEDLRSARGDEPTSRSRPSRWRCPSPAAVAGRSGSTTWSSGTPRPARSCCPVRPDRAAGQTVALVGADRCGQVDAGEAGRPVLRPAGRPRPAGRRGRCARWPTTSCAATVVMVTQENFLFSGSVADNIALGRPGASRAEVVAAAAAGRRRRVHRASCPTGTTPTCASAAAGSRPVSASWSRSPGRSWPTRPCWCWTRRRRAWTCRASARCRPRWRRCWPTGPR